MPKKAPAVAVALQAPEAAGEYYFVPSVGPIRAKSQEEADAVAAKLLAQ